MPAWLAILTALVAIYMIVHPSHGGYEWYLRLRRPHWFDFEHRSPLIWLGLYVCFFISARLVLEPQWHWGYAVGFLLLLAMAQGTIWLICTSRSLTAGLVLGIVAWLWNLGMILALIRASTTAAALLVPYLIWGPVEFLGRQQMRGLNKTARNGPTTRSTAARKFPARKSPANRVR
jgi:benzodiazapine receptor